MKLFRRVLRWLFFLSGFLCGVVVAVAAFFAQRLIAPSRQRLWATPDDVGLEYEEVQFPAQDGLRLSGWFVPAAADSQRQGATVVLIHGWPWNRLGEAADDLFANVVGATPVDLLRLLFALHQEGFNVLTFDLRNHGESASAPPMTFGLEEHKDLLGALAYLETRDDVDADGIAVVGFSMGANTLLYTLPHTDQIKAAVAVQPTSIDHFASRFGAHLTGALAKLILPLTELIYRLAGGPAFDDVRPETAVSRAFPIPVLYVQGSGDPWGSVDDVQAMAAATVAGRGPLIVDTRDRFGGYQYVVDNPKVVVAFLEQHLLG